MRSAQVWGAIGVCWFCHCSGIVCWGSWWLRGRQAKRQPSTCGLLLVLLLTRITVLPAAHYEDLMNAEAQGKSGKKGQWSSKEPPKPHVNDVSLPGTSAR